MLSWLIKFDKFIFIISKRSQTHEENYIILYTLSLKKKLHTCIIVVILPLYGTLIKLVPNTHTPIMHTFIILLF